MRLLVQRDNGETLAIDAAVEENPVAIRNILADAYFLCESAISESSPVEFLQTEQAIRQTLLEFQANTDRYARSYIINRIIDPHTSKTPRAGLMIEAFQCGGPLALVGAFYATIDAHRNQRNRSVLGYLLNNESSRRELFCRSRAFPCHPSVSAWLIRILQKLDTPAQGLAHLLRELGSTPLVRPFFLWVGETSPTWGADGAVVNIGARLAPCLESYDISTTSLQALETIGFIRSTSIHVHLDSHISDLLKDHLGGSKWLAEAVKALCHVFPKYQGYKTELYSTQCEALLPQLSTVLEHLYAQPGTLSHLTPLQLIQVAEASLSASNFRDHKWRALSVSIALQSTQQIPASDQQTLLYARIETRKAALAYLYHGSITEWQGGCISLPTRETLPHWDRRSRAVLAEAAIAKARDCITINALTLAHQHLQDCEWSQSPLLSPIEQWHKEQVQISRARLLRFEGRFREALSLLDIARQTYAVETQKAKVLIELEEFEEARKVLLAAPAVRPIDLRSTRLNIANANLMEVTHTVRSGGPLNRGLLQRSQAIYQEIETEARGHQKTYFGKIDYLSALMGVAMTEHLGSRIDAALDSWEKALIVSQTFLPRGYTDMIISYSLSELELRKRAYPQPTLRNEHAVALLARTGRQYHFVGLGTAWPDLLAIWYADHGRPPLLPVREPSVAAQQGVRLAGTF